MNYYPFHIGDYAAHTAHLEPMEDLAYRRILDVYYLREEPLTADPADVARLIRMKGNVAEVETVLEEFFYLTEEGWKHERCDEEIGRMQDKQAKAKASAAASVNARKAKTQNTESERSTNVERTLSERSTDVELPTPTPTPTPEEKTPPTPLSGGRVKFEPLAMALPDCVPVAAWAEWIEYRKSRRLTCSEATMVKQLRFLTEASTRGNPPQVLIDTAIRNGWQGLFEPSSQAARRNSEPVRRQARQVYQ